MLSSTVLPWAPGWRNPRRAAEDGHVAARTASIQLAEIGAGSVRRMTARPADGLY